MTEEQREEMLQLIAAAWEEADNVMSSTLDEDPCASEVSAVLCDAYQAGDDCKEALNTLEAFLTDLELIEDVEEEAVEKTPCKNCGQR
jgi:hypothetical protein